MEGLRKTLLDWLNHLICRTDVSLPLGLVKGDAVHVWSDPKSRWVEDGIVQEGTVVDKVVNGSAIPAGSLRVEFDRGSGAQWILPIEARKLLRKVPRPRAPPPASEAALGPGTADVLQELRSVEHVCRLSGQLFADSSFRVSPGGRVAVVLRPQQITRHDGLALRAVAERGPCGVPMHGAAAAQSDWRLFRGTPRAGDVQQGELGDCWFLSSLAALAEFQEGRFVRALLPGQEDVSPVGAYVVRLCLGGCWRGVLVDDRFPCIGGGIYHTQLAYCVTKRMQLWASVIEKAFAKACGSYEAIKGGEACEALEMLTGWPCTMVIFERPDFDPEMLWASLCSSRDAAFLMTCSTKRVKSRSLEPDHVYSLMDVHEVADACGNLVRLLKIRNPHAKSKWQGAWSDSSKLWTPHLRRQLDCPEGGSPQLFFMAFEDFLQEFAHCTICRIRSSEWHEAREQVHLPRDDVPHAGIEVEVSEMTECCISLLQPGERLRGGPFHPSLSEPLACIGFALLRLEGGGQAVRSPVTATAAAQMRHSAAVSVDCWLPAGRYLLVPLSLHRGSPLLATLAFVSSRQVKLKKCGLDSGTVKMAWMAYARETDPHGKAFYGAVLRFGKSEGGAVVVSAENCTDKYLRVQLSFTSASLSFSRGQAGTVDVLPPSHGQILQVAQPSGTEKDPVSWSESHTFTMGSRGPGQHHWHSPPVEIDGTELHAPVRLADPRQGGACPTMMCSA
mmetsp:Transcript_103998/g.294152  ORF Transcript_103998/g.294152 Transcript_103998/m.294152 type:complete len:729 (+) Transcript_103998:64-2250(+)|eukprot:CAMPEP_0168506448 /NCGR_PEP_ID=MMETSP0228-20121227/77379_1 /TAXON_ID=133427 /ORGANISM="Protoceratium reticulatum, Strain CCCM 535 (=CCMP 1889)" /LENGTH=728 /DNA_ID=CAMNT_0008523541 /DNA_START=58 /DNA_END=2244 /DNA_ORIENTATION=+